MPEPNSPEALRAAQKVRNVFYMIAAANLVIIAIVMWPRPKLPPRSAASAATAPAHPVLAEMEAVHNRLLAAYRSRDAERFAEEFSRAARPAVDEDYFREVIIGDYHEQYGELTAVSIPEQSNLSPENPTLVSAYTSKKGPKTKGSAVFIREDGQLRLEQWRLDPAEETSASP